MKISLTIPAYNEESQIGACLESIRKSKGMGPYEIIVVDNASTDRTPAIASSYPGVKVVYEGKKGTGPARDKCFRTATGDIVAYMDADCRLAPGWLEKIDSAFTSNPNLVLLSGPYQFYDISERINIIIHWFFWKWFPLGCTIAGCTAIGGNMAIRRDALEKINGFDTSIVFYGEDTDVAARLQKLGRVDFDPSLVMPSSARRYKKDGVLKTVALYTLNGFWWLIFSRPFSAEHTDVR